MRKWVPVTIVASAIGIVIAALGTMSSYTVNWLSPANAAQNYANGITLAGFTKIDQSALTHRSAEGYAEVFEIGPAAADVRRAAASGGLILVPADPDDQPAAATDIGLPSDDQPGEMTPVAAGTAPHGCSVVVDRVARSPYYDRFLTAAQLSARAHGSLATYLVRVACL
jgi:hypothetical protein